MTDGRVIEGEYEVQEVQLTDEQIEALAEGERVEVERRIEVSPARNESYEAEDMQDFLEWLFSNNYVHDWERSDFQAHPDECEWISFWEVHPNAVETLIENVERHTPHEFVEKEPHPGANTDDTGNYIVRFENSEA